MPHARSGRGPVTPLLAGLLLAYYVLPLLALVAVAPDALSRLGDAGVRSAVTTTLAATTVSTLLALAFGVPLAHWLARRESRLADAVTALVAFPLVLPPVVAGLLLLTALGPRGPLGGLSLTSSFAGVVLAQTFVASPFLVISAKSAFEGVDPDAERAARTLGASGRSTFLRVTLPLARRGVLAGTMLAFARAAGEFGATAMLAYYPRTMPVQIWVSFLGEGSAAALPLAALLVGVSLLVLFVLSVLGASPWR
jgi:molybdate/tungstate transport system permease protein